MRTTLHLPAKAPRVTLAQYASTLPKPAEPFVAPPAPERSKLFAPAFTPAKRPSAVRTARLAAAGTFTPTYPLRAASGGFDRPDLSEPTVSLTFKWSPT